jgi:hypothetical protein
MDPALARLIIMKMVAGLTPEQLIEIIRTVDNDTLLEALNNCPQPDCVFCEAARETVAARNEYINVH